MGIIDLVRRPLRARIVTSGYPERQELTDRGRRGTPVYDAARCGVNRACEAVCPTAAITIRLGGEGPDQWSIE